jgi:catechol 2,3-dioxygenase
VHLRTRSFEGVLPFYSDVLGLKILRQSERQTAVSGATGEPALIVLSEEPGAVLPAHRSSGLYHFALRYPGRASLGRAYRRLLEERYPIAGASDHGVSEALYLSDPDGNGIELYTDRPRDQWSWRRGEIAMKTEALDLESLLAVSEKEIPEAPDQIDIGHIHLHVADLSLAERFYSEFLGLAVTQRSYPGALFFAAGTYHHHVGVNVWGGTATPPPDSVGLISYRLEVPVAEILYCLDHRAPLLGYETRKKQERTLVLQIRDPNGHWLEVDAGPTEAKLGSDSVCLAAPGLEEGSACFQGRE